jgi:hypothetical protein
MPHLTLPARTPGSLRAFALVAASGLSLVVATAVAGVRRDSRFVPLALPLAGMLAAPALRDPWLVDVPYRGWNRLGSEVGVFADRYVSRVAYEALRATRAIEPGAGKAFSAPEGSGWFPRETQSVATYHHQDSAIGAAPGRDAFDRYARRPMNGWAEALRPLVRLLAAVETGREADESPPPDVYTLY